MDSIDYNDVDVVQFMEKRSLEDGMDVGDVFRGARRIRMAGTLYGRTRALLFDGLIDLRAALDPVLAQQDEPADKGYQPLYFSVPTNRVDVYPTGYIDLRILCMPRALGYMIQRDSLGGDEEDSLAIPWQATLIARDPRIMAEEAQEYAIDSAPATITGDLVNRGNHYAPLNMLIQVGTAAGSIAVQAGTSVFTITVGASSNVRLIRVKGSDKIVTFQEFDGVNYLTEVTDMDAITFTGDNTWAQAQPGTLGYSITYTGVTAAVGSLMWFWEAYA